MPGPNPSWFLLASLLLAPAAWADDIAEEHSSSPWSGKGELGFASASGNSTTESLNGRLNLEYQDRDWVHRLDVFGLHARAKFTGTDPDGNYFEERRTTAERYSLTAGSALQVGEHRQFTSSLRMERDEFAIYDRQTSFSIGYGTRWLDTERAQLDVQLGPGYRRAHDTNDDHVEAGLIGRGFMELKYVLTENTELANTLLVESGETNTFAQNDLGVSVAMNSHLALKAGWQARHNSDADPPKKQTDTLTTVNLVYRFK